MLYTHFWGGYHPGYSRQYYNKGEEIPLNESDGNFI